MKTLQELIKDIETEEYLTLSQDENSEYYETRGFLNDEVLPFLKSLLDDGR